MRSQGIEGLTRKKIGNPHRWFANFRVMEAVAPLAVNHPYLGLQAIIFDAAYFWSCLCVGSVMIWDDYVHSFDSQQSTKAAVDLFLGERTSDWRLIINTGQRMMIERIA